MIQDYYVDEDDDDGRQSEDDGKIPTFHYVWIKDLSRLVSSQLSKNHRVKHICDRCLHYFISRENLAAHEVDCRQINQCRVNLPTTSNNTLEFKNYKYKERVPFVVYADFECLLKATTPHESQPQKTEFYQEHEAFSVGYYLHCSYDERLSYYRSYQSPKPAEWLADELLVLARRVEELYQNVIPMTPLTHDQKKAFKDASICHICEKPLHGSSRVRDHCHLTGRFRGAAHEECNLSYQDSRDIPVIFHNFTGYDSHLIIKEISTRIDGRINVLPLNMEKYIAFIKHVDGCDMRLKFIDSLRFMASSLDKLASYLPELRIMKSCNPQMDDEQLQLLTRKGVFPYEYLDSWDKLKETDLPSQASFYSQLNGCGITEADYEHAKKVWTSFNVRNLGDYAQLYLKTDVLLLADVFENFRDNCIKTYGLDPAHYYTAPGLTWVAMLKHTNIKLELLMDIDMVMFIERGIRGGISQCSNRYAKANNRYDP